MKYYFIVKFYLSNNIEVSINTFPACFRASRRAWDLSLRSIYGEGNIRKQLVFEEHNLHFW